MKIHRYILPLFLCLPVAAARAETLRHVQVTTPNGILEGVVSADGLVRSFKGVPYAAPPVGPLRWQPPQPVAPWTGVRKALDFGPRAMQGRIYSDMVFRDKGPSEDCLYLNVWLPENPPTNKLPVMVWIHGGGFVAGASSEPRQDGGNLSKLGVIVVSFNYRMGIFGFFAHPELAKESANSATGNYGLLDQVAALQWVKQNIAAFGGDPDNVTLFGESAGSFSVSALMATPLAKGLFQRAIGESGALFSKIHPPVTRAEAGDAGVKFARVKLGTSSLEKLRAMSAKKLLKAALKVPQQYFRPDVDGYFLPTDVTSIYAAGQQSHVSLLAGWNRDEGYTQAFYTSEPPAVTNDPLAKVQVHAPKPVFTNGSPTLEDYVACAHKRFGANADEFLKLYPATTDAEAKRAAADYAGDRFIAYSTWKWLELHLKTGESPVYRYHFEQTLPLTKKAKPGTEPTAPHASDIEFVFRMLPSRHVPWGPNDHKVSEMMAQYWSNFAKNGDPNGPGLPPWPQYNSAEGYQVMHLKTDSAAAPDSIRARYEFLDRLPLPW